MIVRDLYKIITRSKEEVYLPHDVVVEFLTTGLFIAAGIGMASTEMNDRIMGSVTCLAALLIRSVMVNRKLEEALFDDSIYDD